MPNTLNEDSNNQTLAIHCTDSTFGFAYRKNNNSDEFFIKRFDKDLCNNLIFDFNQFISRDDLQKVKKIAVSIGPANFNASRLIVVLARTISQQINCPLISFTSFELMSKRIALQNNIYKTNQSFCIYKQLKKKGFIAGKYHVNILKQKDAKLIIKETSVPKIVEELKNEEQNFQAIYDDEQDLKELLSLSNDNQKFININSWEEVLPLYTTSPVS